MFIKENILDWLNFFRSCTDENPSVSYELSAESSWTATQCRIDKRVRLMDYLDVINVEFKLKTITQCKKLNVIIILVMHATAWLYIYCMINSKFPSRSWRGFSIWLQPVSPTLPGISHSGPFLLSYIWLWVKQFSFLDIFLLLQSK